MVYLAAMVKRICLALKSHSIALSFQANIAVIQHEYIVVTKNSGKKKVQSFPYNIWCDIILPHLMLLMTLTELYHQ